MDTPWSRTYWVVPGLFLAGCYPGDPDPAAAAAKMRALKVAGIRHIVNLMEEHETAYDGRSFAPYTPLLDGMHMVRHAVKDLSVPSNAKMAAILADIDGFLDRGEPVFVHCWGGIGRTGTAVGCWLSRHGYPGAAALSRIRELRQREARAWRESPETREQRAFILRY